MKKIVFIHSLNNYTGSPNVLSIVVRELLQRGYAAEIITSRNMGFLSSIEGAEYRYSCYRWCKNEFATMGLLILSQIEVFIRCLFGSRKHIYYINTIIPFGAIVGCWLTRKQFVIHVHEDMQQRKPLYRFLKQVYRVCNTKSVFVSNYLTERAVGCRNGIVAMNALSDSFFNRAIEQLNKRVKGSNNTILMISSLRGFKGVYEFVELARLLTHRRFELVMSAEEDEVVQFKAEIGMIDNLTLFAQQNDLHPFYQRAKLVLNLSHPDKWIETFGLTILEAMAYGVPTIAPNVGGPTELVENGVSGFLVDPLNLTVVCDCIEALMSDSKMYDAFSNCAR